MALLWCPASAHGYSGDGRKSSSCSRPVCSWRGRVARSRDDGAAAAARGRHQHPHRALSLSSLHCGHLLLEALNPVVLFARPCERTAYRVLALRSLLTEGPAGCMFQRSGSWLLAQLLLLLSPSLSLGFVIAPGLSLFANECLSSGHFTHSTWRAVYLCTNIHSTYLPTLPTYFLVYPSLYFHYVSILFCVS
jgi:hypothetical protein